MHNGQPIGGVLRPDRHMGVDLAQIHMAVALMIIAPPAEELAKKIKLRQADMGKAMTLKVHDLSALRQRFDHVVEMIDKIPNLGLTADLGDHRFHGSALRPGLFWIVMRQRHDHGGQALLLAVELAHLQRGADLGMGDIDTGESDVLAQER
jgi:hypothetical protein